MITLTEVPASSGGILGALSTSVDLNGLTLSTAFPTTRAVSNGTIATGFAPGFANGTLVGSLNLATGVWTAPGPLGTWAWYDFSLLFSLSIDGSPFNNLTSVSNPDGFVSLGGPPSPTKTIAGTPDTIEFNNYFGRFAVAITDTSGGIIICSNERLLTYDSSSCVISASYTARYLEGGTQLVCRYLNRVSNNIVGQPGNSFHFTATHIRNAF